PVLGIGRYHPAAGGLGDAQRFLGDDDRGDDRDQDEDAQPDQAGYAGTLGLEVLPDRGRGLAPAAHPQRTRAAHSGGSGIGTHVLRALGSMNQYRMSAARFASTVAEAKITNR